jgi:hypothetical protein
MHPGRPRHPPAKYRDAILPFELAIVDTDDFSDSERASIKALAKNFLVQTDSQAR